MTRLIALICILMVAACATPQRSEPAPEPAEPSAPSEPQVAEPAPQAQPERVRRQPDRVPEIAEPVPVEPEPVAEPVQRRVPQPEATVPEPEPVQRRAPRPQATVPEPEPVATPEPAPVGGAALAGRVSILRNGQEQRFADTHLNQTVVAWLPDSPTQVAPLEEQQIVTRSSRFFPQTLVVTSGTSIRFPNLDSIQHNVFSLSPGHRFDVGLYGSAEGATHVFNGTGTVDLFCNVHANMAAFVLVLETPHFVQPGPDGQFRLDNLPEGSGQLLVWNYRAEQPLSRRTMTLQSGLRELDLDLDVTRPAVPQHTNKHGENYAQRRRGNY